MVYWGLAIVVLVLLFVSLLSFLFWEATHPTQQTDAYLQWFREDRAIQKSINRTWKEGNWS